jgi:uncharacterized membrane protein
MKNLLLLLVFVAVSGIALFAQDKKAPATEFLLELSSSALEVMPGESKDVTVTINRSKSFAKSDVTLGLSSGLPAGVTVTFEPSQGLLESSIAKIAVAENAKAGNYTIILNGTIRHKSKGATLKLVVAGSNQGITAN